MMEELRRIWAVAATVHVRDRDTREFLVRDIFQASKVHPVHLPDRRFVPNAEGTHAAVPAKVAMILPGVEQVLRQGVLSLQQTESFRCCHGRPEAGAPTDRAVAAVAALGEIEVSLELHGSAVATAVIGPTHASTRAGSLCATDRTE